MKALLNRDNSVFFVSGPLHSGKTTRLREWSQGRTDVGGVFQPVIDDRRHFIDIRTGTKMLMDAPPHSQDAYTIGRFHFAISSFLWAADALRSAAQDSTVQYLIVDEVGPLEMQSVGLHPFLEEILTTPRPGLAIILVIRDYLLQDVITKYGVPSAQEFSYPA